MSPSSSSPPPFEGDYSFVNVVTDGTWPESWGKPPKTRKRITKQQLEMLEDLFRTHSHPSREERQTLALKTGMELRSVTIWLQNKRQLVKKNARAKQEGGAPETASSPSSAPASPPPPSTRTTASPSPTADDDSSSTHVPPHPLARPTLDRVASLSEYPSPVRPVTIKDTPNQDQSEPLWSHMPSSPPTSPTPIIPRPPANNRGRAGATTPLHKVSGRPYPPLSRTASTDSASTCTSNTSIRQRETERAKYLKPSMTLEWACAQAARRPTEEEEKTSPSTSSSQSTLPLSRASSATLATSDVDVGDIKASDAEMQAALALCGLLAG